MNNRVGINPGFIIKPNQVGFMGFMRAGFGGFYVGLINLKVFH